MTMPTDEQAEARAGPQKNVSPELMKALSILMENLPLKKCPSGRHPPPMPIYRKSKAKPTRYDRAQKYGREKAEEALMDLLQALPAERPDYIRHYLFRAYITGYERAKREARNAK